MIINIFCTWIMFRPSPSNPVLSPYLYPNLKCRVSHPLCSVLLRLLGPIQGDGAAVPIIPEQQQPANRVKGGTYILLQPRFVVC